MNKILIANRGEIALRVIRTCKRLGIQTVSVFSEADAGAPFTQASDESYLLGPAPATESYLHIERVISIAKDSGVDGIHPGYGFLSENSEFSKAVQKAGITFIGPEARILTLCGEKNSAKVLARSAGVPVISGYLGEQQDEDTLAAEAKKLGFPLLIKAVGGGGGRGMRVVEKLQDFSSALEQAQREAASAFSDSRVLLEQLIKPARHIEVQIAADSHGNVLHFFERDCSLQRRHQKILEFTPASGVKDSLLEALFAASVNIAKKGKLHGLMTVEFLVPTSSESDDFYFLEINPRLQVEHPVTEKICGVDLVELQINIARGEAFALKQKDIARNGAAIEARVCGESPGKSFTPSTGTLFFAPDCGQSNRIQGIRADHALTSGLVISPYYDSLLAKLISYSETLGSSSEKLIQSLKDFPLLGVDSNSSFLIKLLEEGVLESPDLNTDYLDQNLDRLLEPEEEFRKALLAAVALESSRSDFTGSPLQHFRSGASCSLERVEDKTFFRSYRVSGALLKEDLNLQFQTSGSEGKTLIRTPEQEFTTEVQVLGGDNKSLRTISLRVGSNEIIVRVLTREEDPLFGYAFLEGSHFSIERQLPKSLADESLASLQIKSSLPGTILDVFVKEGQTVSKGEVLLILESMKIEHKILAPRNAKVAEVLVKAQDAIDFDAVLLNFESTSTE